MIFDIGSAIIDTKALILDLRSPMVKPKFSISDPTIDAKTQIFDIRSQMLYVAEIFDTQSQRLWSRSSDAALREVNKSKTRPRTTCENGKSANLIKVKCYNYEHVQNYLEIRNPEANQY